jgi:hypothetical protein
MAETLAFISGVTGLADLGIRFFNADGTWNGARITAGITEQDANTGTYFITVAVPASATGVHWDSTGTPTVFGDEIFDSPGYSSIADALAAEHGAGSWESSGSGTGAYTITVTVTDGTDPLQNATVRVTSGVDSFTVVTDASGQGQFALDGGSYDVGVTKGGYQFTPTTRTVTGNETGTLTNDLVMTQTVIPSPTDPTLCRLYGWFLLPSGAPAINEKLEATLVSVRPTEAGGSVIVRTSVSALTDNDGYAQLDVIKTDEFTPTPTYTIRMTAAGINIPNVSLTADTVDVQSLLP